MIRAVGRSFGPICSRPPRISQLWVKQLVSTRHHWADIFMVRRQGPDGRKGSTNSTATCSIWRGMGSARLYLPKTHHAMTTHNHTIPDRSPPGSTTVHQVCYWCVIEDSRKRQHHHRHLEHKDSKSCRETSGTNTRNGQVQMKHPWTQ